MKKMIIVRGPSGAGKGTYIKNVIAKTYDQVVVCSADDYFNRTVEAGAVKPEDVVVDNRGDYAVVYDFDVGKLPQAHQRCMNQCLQAIRAGEEVIVVDNTFTRRWEWVNYEAIAMIAGYKVEIVEIVPRTIEELRICANRNLHRVPESVVASMAMRFEHDDRAEVFSVA